MFSAIGIALTIVQKVYVPKAGSDLDNYLTVLSVFIGLFVIVISLIEWGFSGSVKAEALHGNAELLNQHQRKIAQALATSGDPSEAVVTQLREEYEAIKDSCSYNHEPVDDEFFRAQQRLSREYLYNDGTPQMSWFAGKWSAFMDQWSSAKVFLVFWAMILGLLVITPWRG